MSTRLPLAASKPAPARDRWAPSPKDATPIPPLRLSIDGQHGRDYATQHTLDAASHRAEALIQQALALPGQVNRDGHNGYQARPAVSGAPAGHITLRLSESDEVNGGIRIDVSAVDPPGEVPSVIEVPVGQDIFISAIGGNGENGLDGGNGQNGLDGENGLDATEVTDATPGSSGGNGGNAGSGSSGGDGGQGGTIEIVIDDTQTNLLMAFSCVLEGGSPGDPGKHGKRGTGGIKGQGGKKHEWKVLVDYSYSCTNGCIGSGGDPGSGSNSLVRLGSVVNRERAQLMARISTQTITGNANNIVATLAGMAAIRQAARRPRIDPGACRCHGGTGNCVGCEAVPIYKTYRRVQGLDGVDGTPGQPITTHLTKGQHGGPGQLEIVVNSAGGEQRRYSSIYELQLEEFSIEDENGDSIFEPGEYIYIRRIKVKNLGHMPSPARNIPVTFAFADSDWLIPVEGEEGQAFLPPSIPPGHAGISTGAIKVRIRERRENEKPPLGSEFFHETKLNIKATMPWLNRDLPLFNVTNSIKIQYPYRLQNLNQLATMALGSRNMIEFEVFNKGNTAAKGVSRPIEIDITFPPEYGELKGESGQWQTNVTRILPNVPGQKSVSVQQELHIHGHAVCYQNVPLDVTLYLGKPSELGREGHVEIVDIHQMQTTMQISDHYSFKENANFLLVTNSGTSRARAQAIRRFIQDDLKMEVDTWNVELYGSLQYLNPNTRVSSPIIDAYPGKSLIFLGNRFDFFDAGQRTVLDLCNPLALANILAKGTNCVFLETTDFASFEKLANSSIFHPGHKVAEVDQTLVSSDKFSNLGQMITSLQEGKQRGVVNSLHLNFPSRKAKLGKSGLKSEIKRTSRSLAKSLPSDRCMVTVAEMPPTPGETASSKASAQVTISMGLPYNRTFAAAEPCKPGNQSYLLDDYEDEIDALEKYMITWSLPLNKRVILLWEAQPTANSFVNRCISMCLALTLNREVTALAKSDAPIPEKLGTVDEEEIQACVAANLPTLAALLDHPVAINNIGSPNPGILFVLKIVIASAATSKKRHPFSRFLIRVQDLLRLRIGYFLQTKGMTKEEIKNFFKEAADTKSKLGTVHKTVESLLVGDLATLLQCTEHVVRKGIKDANDIVQRTVSIDPEEWDKRVIKVQEYGENIKKDEAAAKKIRGTLVVDEIGSEE